MQLILRYCKGTFLIGQFPNWYHISISENQATRSLPTCTSGISPPTCWMDQSLVVKFSTNRLLDCSSHSLCTFRVQASAPLDFSIPGLCSGCSYQLSRSVRFVEIVQARTPGYLDGEQGTPNRRALTSINSQLYFVIIQLWVFELKQLIEKMWMPRNTQGFV